MEFFDNGIIKYLLEEYMEVENDLVILKLIEKVVEDVIFEELNIILKLRVEFVQEISLLFVENIFLMELIIEEILRLRVEERRKKLKEFNYKFYNNVLRIDEFEKEFVYKRLGIDFLNI